MKKLLIINVIICCFLTGCMSVKANARGYGIQPVKAGSRDLALQAVDKFDTEMKVHIAIGISNYNTKNTGFGKLRYAARDANLLLSTFKAKGYHSIPILDHNANKQTILNKIKRAGQILKRGKGTLVFTYSGHGYKQAGRSYLATYDAYAKNLRGSGLTVHEVIKAIRATGVRRAVLLIDACRNNPIPGQKAVGFSKALGGIHPGRGIQILYSVSQGSLSWEHPDIQQGVFSYFVNNALRGHAATRSGGAITFDNLASYVMREVPLWTDGHLSQTQQPHRTTAGESYGDFVLSTSSINPPKTTQPVTFTKRNQETRNSSPRNSPEPEITF